jgi:serine/threonine-protein kinase
MLTGRPPFPGENAIKVMIAHASQDVTPPSQIRAEIPADLEAIVLRCLAKHPADRFQDAASLAAALAACECADGWSRQHAAQWWSDAAIRASSTSPARASLQAAGVD